MRHLKALSFDPNVVELDPKSSGIAQHLKRYTRFLGEHLNPENDTEMSRLGLVVSIIGAIKAC